MKTDLNKSLSWHFFKHGIYMKFVFTSISFIQRILTEFHDSYVLREQKMKKIITFKIASIKTVRLLVLCHIWQCA